MTNSDYEDRLWGLINRLSQFVMQTPGGSMEVTCDQNGTELKLTPPEFRRDQVMQYILDHHRPDLQCRQWFERVLQDKNIVMGLTQEFLIGSETDNGTGS